MFKEMIFKELIKNGYSKADGKRIWTITDTSLLYLTPEMAKTFLKLKEHPRYKATIIDIEIKLLKKHIADFLKCVEECVFNLIDMGCSEGTKAQVVIESLSEDMQFRYCPVSVNKHFIDLALSNVKKRKFKSVIDYAPRLSSNFESLENIGAALRNSKYQKNVILFLGSLLGSFDINDCLFRLSQSMLPGDIMVIGNGIRTGERFASLESYKHPIFNVWFINLIKELGFSNNEVEYEARFSNERVEGFYKINIDKEIVFDRAKVQFKKGDEIVVSVLYKYYAHELENFCKMYFPEVKLVKDPQEEYALVFCKK